MALETVDVTSAEGSANPGANALRVAKPPADGHPAGAVAPTQI